MTNEQRFKALLSRLHAEVFKPLGWKKDGQNFRFFQEDGLCRIVNFQKSAYNDAQVLSFYINLGVYYEVRSEISNRKFKEHECILRRRVSGNVEKWNIFEGRDMEKLFEELKTLLDGDVMDWFSRFQDREGTIFQFGFQRKYIV